MFDEGGKLTEITRDVINKKIMLNPNTNWAIDPQELHIEYKENELIYKRKLASFRAPHIKGDDRKLTPQKTSPYNTYLFINYFVDTYYALCQVCVADARNLISNWMLMICMDIQSKDINRPCNYASLVTEGLHNALCDFKMGKSIVFRYYSLLMHIFLYKVLKV